MPLERAETKVRVRSNKDTTPVIKRTQFSSMVAWGCTVHKVQRITLDKVVISFNLLRQMSFNYGQIYFTMSRVTSSNGLYLICKFSVSTIRAGPRAIHENQRF